MVDLQSWLTYNCQLSRWNTDDTMIAAQKNRQILNKDPIKHNLSFD